MLTVRGKERMKSQREASTNCESGKSLEVGKDKEPVEETSPDDTLTSAQ